MVSSDDPNGDDTDRVVDGNARDILDDARDVVAAAREAVADARDDEARLADEARDQRDALADERERRSDRRDAYAATADHARESRDWLADERDRLNEEREAVASRVARSERAGSGRRREDAKEASETAAARQRDVAKVLTEAAHRDFLANRRDSAANRRDMKASLDSFLTDHDDEAAHEARGLARKDRTDSRLDRTSSATDRVTLSTAIGELELPASIPTNRAEATPLDECTAEEVSTHAALLLEQSVDETRDAIDSVEHDGAASPRVKELLHASMSHHHTAADLAWYVDEWLRTGSRPPQVPTEVVREADPSAVPSKRGKTRNGV